MTVKNKPVLQSEIERELFNPVERSIKGLSPFILNPIDRLSNYFNFYPGQYILIGSITGVGKTSYLDHNMLHIIQNKPKDIHFEVLYYSMERKKKVKYAKWISWKMYNENKTRVSSDTISNRLNSMQIEQLDHLRTEYGPWLEDVLDYIDLREGPRSVETIKKDIDKLARKLGAFYHADDTTIYRYDKAVGSFDSANFVTTKYGKRLYAEIEYEDETHVLYQNDKIYLTPKPTIVFIIIDHIGKVRSVPGGKKNTLDELDQVLSDARDNYLFSPIPISQFNRAISSVDRLKYNQGDLDPVLEDFKDTGNLTESADLVLSLFDPGRYKSWDAAGNYKGYNIRDAMVTPIGQKRARSIHILKHTNGIDGVSQVLRFTGESMYFEAMPVPEDEAGLQVVYREIIQGK